MSSSENVKNFWSESSHAKVIVEKQCEWCAGSGQTAEGRCDFCDGSGRAFIIGSDLSYIVAQRAKAPGAK